MHHLNHVHRRGAVYVWRRRMPATSSKACGFIQVSLRTRDFSTAKNLANLLNRTFCDSILRVKTQKITRAEAQQFLTAVVSDELKRIEAERYAEPQATTPQEWREWFFRFFISDHFFHHAIHLSNWSEIPRPTLHLPVDHAVHEPRRRYLQP